MRRLRSTVRAALWSVVAVRIVRRELGVAGPDGLRLPPPPPVGPEGDLGVNLVLRASGSTCFTSATVRQAWLAARGDRRDLVVGVTAPRPHFRAHAWLEGDAYEEDFQELLRRPAG